MSKLAEIKEYLSKMTPGPWRAIPSGVSVYQGTEFVGDFICCLAHNKKEREYPFLIPNAVGIARLRSDAEWLVKRCEELEERLRKMIQGYRNLAEVGPLKGEWASEAKRYAAEAERLLKGGE